MKVRREVIRAPEGELPDDARIIATDARGDSITVWYVQCESPKVTDGGVSFFPQNYIPVFPRE